MTSEFAQLSNATIVEDAEMVFAKNEFAQIRKETIMTEMAKKKTKKPLFMKIAKHSFPKPKAVQKKMNVSQTCSTSCAGSDMPMLFGKNDFKFPVNFGENSLAESDTFSQALDNNLSVCESSDEHACMRTEQFCNSSSASSVNLNFGSRRGSDDSEIGLKLTTQDSTNQVLGDKYKDLLISSQKLKNPENDSQYKKSMTILNNTSYINSLNKIDNYFLDFNNNKSNYAGIRIQDKFLMDCMEQKPAQMIDLKINPRINQVIGMRVAKFMKSMQRILSDQQLNDFAELCNKIFDYIELEESTFKGFRGDSLADALLLLVGSQVGVTKKDFLQNLKDTKCVPSRLTEIKKFLCYRNLKAGLVSILKNKD